MAKATMEVEVVRYFDTAPIDSAQIVYDIIADKMERRIKENSPSPNPVRKRRSRSGAEESQGKEEREETSTPQTEVPPLASDV